MSADKHQAVGKDLRATEATDMNLDFVHDFLKTGYLVNDRPSEVLHQLMIVFLCVFNIFLEFKH